jgi:hypothetical protein
LILGLSTLNPTQVLCALKISSKQNYKDMDTEASLLLPFYMSSRTSLSCAGVLDSSLLDSVGGGWGAVISNFIAKCN